MLFDPFRDSNRSESLEICHCLEMMVNHFSFSSSFVRRAELAAKQLCLCRMLLSELTMLSPSVEKTGCSFSLGVVLPHCPLSELSLLQILQIKFESAQRLLDGLAAFCAFVPLSFDFRVEMSVKHIAVWSWPFSTSGL